jgi:dTMP kinase
MEVQMGNKLIFLEGPDSVGKSSLIDTIYRLLDVEVTQEPYSNDVRDLASSRHSDVTTAAMLYCADRRLHMAEIDDCMVDRDVICDRGPLSTVVYQGLVGGVDLNWIEGLNDTAMEEMKVNATIILYAPFKTICQRMEKRERSSLTKAEMDGLRIIWHAYEKIRRDPDKWTYSWTGKLHFIDADRPADIVQSELVKLVKSIIKGEA